jgi:hypothetical protein
MAPWQQPDCTRLKAPDHQSTLMRSRPGRARVDETLGADLSRHGHISRPELGARSWAQDRITDFIAALGWGDRDEAVPHDERLDP